MTQTDTAQTYELTDYVGGYATYISPDGCHAYALQRMDNGDYKPLKTFRGETAHSDAERYVLSYVLRVVHG